MTLRYAVSSWARAFSSLTKPQVGYLTWLFLEGPQKVCFQSSVPCLQFKVNFKVGLF